MLLDGVKSRADIIEEDPYKETCRIQVLNEEVHQTGLCVLRVCWGLVGRWPTGWYSGAASSAASLFYGREGNSAIAVRFSGPWFFWVRGLLWRFSRDGMVGFAEEWMKHWWKFVGTGLHCSRWDAIRQSFAHLASAELAPCILLSEGGAGSTDFSRGRASSKASYSCEIQYVKAGKQCIQFLCKRFRIVIV